MTGRETGMMTEWVTGRVAERVTKRVTGGDITAYQVLDVPVDVLLHPRGAGSHPASNTTELQGVWLMTSSVAFVSQLGRAGRRNRNVGV